MFKVIVVLGTKDGEEVVDVSEFESYEDARCAAQAAVHAMDSVIVPSEE